MGVTEVFPTNFSISTCINKETDASQSRISDHIELPENNKDKRDDGSNNNENGKRNQNAGRRRNAFPSFPNRQFVNLADLCIYSTSAPRPRFEMAQGIRRAGPACWPRTDD